MTIWLLYLILGDVYVPIPKTILKLIHPTRFKANVAMFNVHNTPTLWWLSWMLSHDGCYPSSPPKVYNGVTCGCQYVFFSSTLEAYIMLWLPVAIHIEGDECISFMVINNTNVRIACNIFMRYNNMACSSANMLQRITTLCTHWTHGTHLSSPMPHFPTCTPIASNTMQEKSTPFIFVALLWRHNVTANMKSNCFLYV